MKLGFSTGQTQRGSPVTTSSDLIIHKYLRFKWRDSSGMLRSIAAYNQQDPPKAAEMLREMADRIEKGLT